MTDVEIANVIGWITYQQEFDLAAFAETFSRREEIVEVTYKPEQNHWLQTHFAPDDTYVAFYRSGRCSITGVKSIAEFQSIVNRINAVMKDILCFNYEPESRITNIVATAELESAVPLEVFAVELGMDSVEYEPEQFPALIYRKQDYVMMIFSSGNMICTGLNDLDDVVNAVEEVRQRAQSLT